MRVAKVCSTGKAPMKRPATKGNTCLTAATTASAELPVKHQVEHCNLRCKEFCCRRGTAGSKRPRCCLAFGHKPFGDPSGKGVNCMCDCCLQQVADDMYGGVILDMPERIKNALAPSRRKTAGNAAAIAAARCQTAGSAAAGAASS